nr:reverse transcriptase domain-containing protein [Tanacetum cinerariifolium]
MEDEFYNLTVKGNDLKTYVRRFQELAVLCPTMVPDSKKMMEVFIGGLPRSIEGNVTASKPQTLEEAITITQRLMDQTCNKVGHLTKNYINNRPTTGSNLLPVPVTCHACGEKEHYKTMAMLFRTEMHVGCLENRGKFCGCHFFALLIVMFNGMAELVLTAMTLLVFCKHQDSLLYPDMHYMPSGMGCEFFRDHYEDSKSVDLNFLMYSNVYSMYSLAYLSFGAITEIYKHNQEEKIDMTWGTTPLGLPYVEEVITPTENWLIYGHIEVLSLIKHNDGLDHYRLSPKQIYDEFDHHQLDAVFA